MSLASDFVAAARKYEGTRWHHLGRSKDGVDCVGLLLLAAEDAGMPHEHPPAYPRGQRGYDLVKACEQMGRRIAINQAQDGDILIFTDGLFPCHVGIRSTKFGVPHVIHAHALRRVVNEEPLSHDLYDQLRFAIRPYALGEN
jgi:cell wall-associated NlpC family hydrolase